MELDPAASEEMRSVAEDISSRFPPARLGTELVLLDIDPRRVHAYWNINPDDMDSARSLSGGEAPLSLRIHDTTGREFDGHNAIRSFDLEVQGLQNHWYIDLPESGRTYTAELGVRTATGALQVLARSNPVSTPPESQSPVYHTQALHVQPRDESGPVATDLKTPPETASAKPPAMPPVTDGGPEPSAPVAAEPDKSFPLVGVGGIPAPERPGPVPIVSLDPYIGYYRDNAGGDPVELEVNTELHIYGRARPGTELRLCGEKIPLRPDGSFSVRKPLPKGAVILPLILSEGGGST